MSEPLPAIEVETAAHPQFSVIWLHGLGADGSDFLPVVPELGLPAAPGLRFVFPHAPMIPVTCNAGYVMRAWYDIKVIDGINREVDEDGIRASCAAVRQLIARENARGVPTQRIILAGFSQGGAIAYTAGLTHPERLAGIVALSAYIPAPGLLVTEHAAVNRHTPVFAAHGTEDDVVPPQLGEQAATLLQAQGVPLEWHTYPMPHSVCLEEVAAIGQWLTTRLNAVPGAR
jgi:phospholipase/carboxylesterase